MLLLLSPALAAPAALSAESAASPDPATVFVPFLQAGMARVGPPSAPPPSAAEGSELLEVSQEGNLAILHDTTGEWFTEAVVNGADPDWILASVQGAFYSKFGDDYEYLTIMLVQDFGMFGAFYSPLANDVTGIGYDTTPGGELFDTSDTKLEGFIFMNYAGYWSAYPELGRYVFDQEFMHRWGAFVNIDKEGLDPDILLGRQTAHWSYYVNTPNSPMEGNTWVDNGDGTYTTDSAAPSTYSDLDLYLMGFVGPEEVGEQTLLLVDDADAEAAGVEPATTPAYLSRVSGSPSDVTLPATPVTFTLDDIIAAEGPRVPAVADSPKTFHMAFAVLVLSADTFGDRQVAEIEGIREKFEADWEEDVGYRADLVTTLNPEVEDTGADTATIDCCKEDAEEPATACGCAASGPGDMLLGAAIALFATTRRRNALRRSA